MHRSLYSFRTLESSSTDSLISFYPVGDFIWLLPKIFFFPDGHAFQRGGGQGEVALYIKGRGTRALIACVATIPHSNLEEHFSN